MSPTAEKTDGMDRELPDEMPARWLEQIQSLIGSSAEETRRHFDVVGEGLRADVRVIDWNGAEYAIDRRPIALCRCGASTRKPFCDGTHSKIGFAAGEAAAGPAAADTPAE